MLKQLFGRVFLGRQLLVIQPVYEELEVPRIVFWKGDGLGPSFLESASESCLEESRVVREQILVNNETFLVWTDEDSGKLRVVCSVAG